MIDLYVRALFPEMESAAEEFGSREFDTVFFGGGTPSMAGPDRIKRILEHANKKFNISSDAEITLEMNPSDVSRENMAGYVAAGINRFTLGIQTLDTAAYNDIGRQGGYCDDALLENYFSVTGAALCADLIAGIPGQTAESWRAGLEKIVRFKPEHISVYLLTLEKGSPYERAKKSFSGSEEDHQIEMFSQTISFLKEKGYHHYEISNFCLPGKESRHNLKYWTWGSWLGLGPAAHSFMDGKRFSNKPSLETYINGNRRVYDDRNIHQEAAEFVMTGLRLRDGFSIDDFKRLFGEDLYALIADDVEALVLKNQLEKIKSTGGMNLRIPDQDIFLSDDITFRMVQKLL